MIPSEWFTQWNDALLWHRAELFLAAGWFTILLLIAIPAFRKGRLIPFTGLLLTAGYLALVVLTEYPASASLFTLQTDGIAVGAKVVAVIMTLIWFGWQVWYPERRSGEYAFVTISILVGTVISAEADHWITAILGMEIVSLSAYIMVAWQRADARAAEAALRYMLFGAISTAVMIYGISWWYGHFGSLSFDAVSESPTAPVLWLLILSGLFFKMGTFPMHFYLPEVYQGMPWPLIGFLGVIPRLGAMALIFRLGLVIQDPTWDMLIACMAGISMLWGSLAALRQDHLKRMIAFSGVAQSGYVLSTGISHDAAMTSTGYLYLGWYGLATILIAMGMQRSDPEEQRGVFSSWTGIGNSLGMNGLVVIAGLASLLGLPPLTGFVAKIMLGLSLAGQDSVTGWVLLGLLLLSTVLSAYYYLRWGVEAYLKKPTTHILHSRETSDTILGLLVVIGLLIPTVWGFFLAHEWLTPLIEMNYNKITP